MSLRVRTDGPTDTEARAKFIYIIAQTNNSCFFIRLSLHDFSLTVPSPHYLCLIGDKSFMTRDCSYVRSLDYSFTNFQLNEGFEKLMYDFVIEEFVLIGIIFH